MRQEGQNRITNAALAERQRRRVTRSGVTLIELVVVIGLTALIAAAVTSAFVAGLDNERLQAQRRSQQDGIWQFEQQITQLLEGAKLSDSTTDTTTYFQSDPNDTGSSGDMGTGRITFTTTALGVPMSVQNSADDFETQQQNQGPVGGLAEVSLGTSPIGDAGDHTGLFERIQRPSDGDQSQGGTERVLSDQIQQIGFQFWDGTQWVTSWDSTTAATTNTASASASSSSSSSSAAVRGTNPSDANRLPAAVQVRYILKNDPTQTVHLLTVPILTSDVTPDNPITTTTTNAGSGGAATQ